MDVVAINVLVLLPIASKLSIHAWNMWPTLSGFLAARWHFQSFSVSQMDQRPNHRVEGGNYR